MRASFLLFLSIAALAQLAAAETSASKPTSLEAQRDSIRRQRDALRQQIGSKDPATTADFEFLYPAPPPPPVQTDVQADCPALADAEADKLINAASEKQKLDAKLVRAIIKQESAFKPCAVSNKGAQGLMQLMPATAEQFHVSDPFDAAQNVEAGATLLKQLMDRYKGDLRSVLAAYNAGATRADAVASIPYPAETQTYIANIMSDLGITEVAKDSGAKN